MEKTCLIQNTLISIPQTVGTKYYKTQITTDKLYNFLSGVSMFLSSGTVDGTNVEIEVRDDYKALFSFSPVENWVKNCATNSAWDMTEAFRPCKLASKGKNIYINVKATDCQAFSFVVYLKQTKEAADVIEYNFQSYDVTSNSNNVIALPANYKFVRGVQVALSGTTYDKTYQLRIEDGRGNLLDDILIDAIKIRSNLHYDKCFFPCRFAGDARDIRVYISKVDGTNPATFGAKVCFLVANIEN